MNSGPVLAMALVAVLAGALASQAEDKYTDKYDNVNLDDILANERLYKKYLKCLLAYDDSHCTPDGKELRSHIPDALTNDCARCTDKQKSGTKKVIKFLRENNSSDWEKLQAKWDPDDIYVRKYVDKL